MSKEFKWIGVDLVDQIECRCGWKSKSYFDGQVWAYRDWQEHAKSHYCKPAMQNINSSTT